jgi:hypothetical protein
MIWRTLSNLLLLRFYVGQEAAQGGSDLQRSHAQQFFKRRLFFLVEHDLGMRVMAVIACELLVRRSLRPLISNRRQRSVEFKARIDELFYQVNRVLRHDTIAGGLCTVQAGHLKRALREAAKMESKRLMRFRMSRLVVAKSC